MTSARARRRARSNDLARAVLAKANVPHLARARTATIVSSSGGTVTISMDGANIASVPRLASYTPTNGDVVLVLMFNRQMVVMGKYA